VPLANGDHVAVYMTDSDLLPAGRAAITKFWLRRFVGSEHVKRRIGYLANPPDVRVAPASTQCLDTHAGNRWLAVGDASMAFDPLAAVGMEKAFEDGCLAADHVSSILRGQPWTPDDYTNIQNRAFAEYLDERHHYYSLEQRWNNSKFWTRRRMFAPNKDKTRLAIHKSK
jgi:2-polyprenyl-6-methoxyphenol hydroxylase-like FAD-dependent oxidoreductase